LGLFIYLVHRHGLWYGPAKGVPLSEKLLEMPLTPSQLKAVEIKEGESVWERLGIEL
jgi:hypothetical protein